MPRIDQVIDLMLDHRAQKAILLSESPILLHTDQGEETDRTFGHRQITSLVEEILPEDLFADLVLMEPVEFDHHHETAVYHLRIVPGPSIWRVVIIRQPLDIHAHEQAETAGTKSSDSQSAEAESQDEGNAPDRSQQAKSGTFLGVGTPPGVDEAPSGDDSAAKGDDGTNRHATPSSEESAAQAKERHVQQGVPKHLQLERETPIQIPDSMARIHEDSKMDRGNETPSADRKANQAKGRQPDTKDPLSSDQNLNLSNSNRTDDINDDLDEGLDDDEDESLDAALDNEDERLDAGFQATIDGDSAGDLDIDLDAVRADIEQQQNLATNQPAGQKQPTQRRSRPAYATHPALPHNTPSGGQKVQGDTDGSSPSKQGSTSYPSLLEVRFPQLDESIRQAVLEQSPELVIEARHKPWILRNKGYGLVGSLHETSLVDDLTHVLRQDQRLHLKEKGWTRFLYDAGLDQGPVRCTLTAGQTAKVVVRIPLLAHPTPSLLGIPEGTVDRARNHGLILVAGRHRSGRTTTASALATALLSNGHVLGLLAGSPPEVRPAIACPLVAWDNLTYDADGTLFDAAHSLSAGFLLLDDATPQTLAEAVTLARDGLIVVAVIQARSSLEAAYRLVDACMTTTMNPISLLDGTIRSMLYQVLVPNRAEDGYVSAYERLVPTRALWEELTEGSGKLLADVLPAMVRPSLSQSIHALDRVGRIPPSVAARLLKGDGRLLDR